MNIRFQKWGNSIAVRIPAQLLKEIGAGEGTDAEISIEDGKLVLAPTLREKRYDFEELLAGITKDNLHDDYFDGPEVGSETW